MLSVDTTPLSVNVSGLFWPAVIVSLIVCVESSALDEEYVATVMESFPAGTFDCAVHVNDPLETALQEPTPA